MSAPPLEDRIIELEARLEFQDETIARLNDELVAQQQRVFELGKVLALLQNQIQDSQIDAQIDPEDEPPPPHY